MKRIVKQSASMALVLCSTLLATQAPAAAMERTDTAVEPEYNSSPLSASATRVH